MATELRQRSNSPYNPYAADYEQEGSDTKGHPPPAKQVGMGMLLGMALAAVVILGFVYYIEEDKGKPDWHMHKKVVDQHKRQQESHALLNKIIQDTHEKHERGELPVHQPTKEELEEARVQQALHDLDHDLDEHEPEAPGMIDALGNQMHDTKYDLLHRLEEFWDLDKNKDAFLSENDFAHLVRRPSHLTPEGFAALDTNKDGAVGIREFAAGFHDQVHMKEPWYHHKYGYVYSHEIPDHFTKAKQGAVKKGTAEHKAALAGVHPAQTQKKVDDAAMDKEHKELNEKAHAQEEIDHAHHDAMRTDEDKEHDHEHDEDHHE